MNSSTGTHAPHARSAHTRLDLGLVGPLAYAAGLGWLGVGIFGMWDVAKGDSGEGLPYALFSIALLLAAVLTLAAAASCTQATDRVGLRRCGLGVGLIAVASTLVAWAGPLWMTLLATSLAVLAVAAPAAVRPALATVAAGHVAGIVATVAAINAEIGRQNSYGDYPAAAGLGVCVAAAGSVLGMLLLVRAVRTGASAQ